MIQPTPVLTSNHSGCIGITGHPLDIAGTTDLELSFPSNDLVLYSGRILVSCNLFKPLQCVLGWDFLTSHGLQLFRDVGGLYSLVSRHGSTSLTPYDCDASSSESPPVQTAKLPAYSDNISPCMLVQSTSRSAIPATLQSNVCLPDRAEVLVDCVLPKSSQEQLGMITPIY